MNIAFYAPMKPPDHPVPSGDRTMARLLIAALTAAGHHVEVASRFRSRIADADRAERETLRAAQRKRTIEAEVEIDRLTRTGRAGTPDIWFTYHNYYKVPDLIGPAVAARLGVPYCLAEASHAPRRADFWGPWHQAAEEATRAAAAVFCFTPRDRGGLSPIVTEATALIDLPPFLDLSGSDDRHTSRVAAAPSRAQQGNSATGTLDGRGRRSRPEPCREAAAWMQARSSTALQSAPADLTGDDGRSAERGKARTRWVDPIAGFAEPADLGAGVEPPHLVAVAMMRPGDKLESFRFLAAALQHLIDRPWRLTIVGDGAAEPEVRAAFARLPTERIHWAGRRSQMEVAALLRQADLYVWPGFGEAFGLSYLEAQAMGCPVLALDVAGVSSVVCDGTTGVLVAAPTPIAYAAALADLLCDAPRRRALGVAAAAWVRRERSLAPAASTIDRVLRGVLALRIVEQPA